VFKYCPFLLALLLPLRLSPGQDSKPSPPVSVTSVHDDLRRALDLGAGVYLCSIVAVVQQSSTQPGSVKMEVKQTLSGPSKTGLTLGLPAQSPSWVEGVPIWPNSDQLMKSPELICVVLQNAVDPAVGVKVENDGAASDVFLVRGENDTTVANLKRLVAIHGEKDLAKKVQALRLGLSDMHEIVRRFSRAVVSDEIADSDFNLARSMLLDSVTKVEMPEQSEVVKALASLARKPNATKAQKDLITADIAHLAVSSPDLAKVSLPALSHLVSDPLISPASKLLNETEIRQLNSAVTGSEEARGVNKTVKSQVKKWLDEHQ